MSGEIDSRQTVNQWQSVNQQQLNEHQNLYVQKDEDERRMLIEQKARELEKNFSFEGYQIVRKELFAHLRDPAVVIRRDSVTFNTACISGLEDTVYIQIMINMTEKKMAIRKCNENDKGALRWCVAKSDKRASRRMSGRAFTSRLYKDMGWDTNCRYKILGYKITAEGQDIYIFDLLETEAFDDTKSPEKRKSKNDTKANQTAAAEQKAAEGQTDVNGLGKEKSAEEGQQESPEQRKRRPGFLPKAWENSYGLSVEENDRYRQINLKEGYESVPFDKQ